MIPATKHPRRGALPAAAIAALLLAGCSSGNVGESWQCPLADAGTCDSVAAADPAVPDMSEPRSAVLNVPLWRVQDPRQPSPAVEAPCDAACDGGFDPIAWLARLFGYDTADREKGRVRPGPAPAARGSDPRHPTGHSPDPHRPSGRAGRRPSPGRTRIARIGR